MSTSSGFASLDDNAIRSTMPQNLLNIDDIYKNYGEALKHYSKVSCNIRKLKNSNLVYYFYSTGNIMTTYYITK